MQNVIDLINASYILYFLCMYACVSLIVIEISKKL